MLQRQLVGIANQVVAAESRRGHHHGGLGMVEVGDERIGHAELVGGEYELIGPAFKLLQQSVGAGSGLGGTGRADTHGADAVPGALGIVHYLAGLGCDKHLLGVHLVLGQVFHLNRVEGTQSAMNRDVGKAIAAYLHHLHQLLAEVQTRRRGSDGSLVLGIDSLEVLHVVGLGRAAVHDVAGQRSLAQVEQLALELIVRAVVEESQRATAARGVVDHLGHHWPVVVEEQLVADAYLAGRLHQHVPEAQLLVQLAQQEHLNLRVGLLLRAVQTGGEHLRVVEDEGVALVEVVADVAEGHVLIRVGSRLVLLEEVYPIAFPVDDHEPALVSAVNALYGAVFILEDAVWRIECHQLLGEFEFKL